MAFRYDAKSFSIDPYHSMSKQKILPVEPLIQCEAGRAKTMQRQSLYSPKTPKWPPSDKGELAHNDVALLVLPSPPSVLPCYLAGLLLPTSPAGSISVVA